jgi:hypothetical protein
VTKSTSSDNVLFRRFSSSFLDLSLHSDPASPSSKSLDTLSRSLVLSCSRLVESNLETRDTGLEYAQYPHGYTLPVTSLSSPLISSISFTLSLPLSNSNSLLALPVLLARHVFYTWLLVGGGARQRKGESVEYT